MYTCFLPIKEIIVNCYIVRMWAGTCSVVEASDSSGCLCENRLCFLRLPQQISFNSILVIQLSAQDPTGAMGPAFKTYTCRAYDLKSLQSRSSQCRERPHSPGSVVLHLMPHLLREYTAAAPADAVAGSIIKLAVQSVTPIYRVPHASQVVVLRSEVEGSRESGCAQYSIIEPAIARHRLQQTIISSVYGAVLCTDVDMLRVHCDVAIIALNSCQSKEGYYLISRRTQLVYANHDSDANNKSLHKSTLAFDIQDDVVSIPLYSRVLSCLRGDGVNAAKWVSSSLLYGDPGSGDFIHALVSKINSDSHINCGRDVECIRISAPIVIAYGKEHSDAELHRQLSYSLQRAVSSPIVLIIENLDILAPARVRILLHSMSKTEDALVRVLCNFFSFLGKCESMAAASVRRHLYIFATATDMKRVHIAVSSCFDETVEMSNPSSITRRHAIRTIYNSINQNNHEIRGRTLSVLDAMAEEGSGMPMNALLHLWTDQLMELISNEEDNKYLSAPFSSDSAVPMSDRVLPLDGVHGLSKVKAVIREVIVWPRLHAETYRRYGLRPPTGVLFYGPPGTGKTMIARRIAKELNGLFLSLKLSDILRGHIGIGEQRVRDIFSEAKAYAPSIVFIDEFQSLFSARAGLGQSENDGDGSSDAVGASLTSALALCLDDIVTWNQYAGSSSLICVIAATNEPWAVDNGFLRPGRFDKKVFVGPLDQEGRCNLLLDGLSNYNIYSEDSPRAKADIVADVCTRMGDFYTGADIALFAQNVKLVHFRENSNALLTADRRIGNNTNVAVEDAKIQLEAGYLYRELGVFKASVTQRAIEDYKAWGISSVQ